MHQRAVDESARIPEHVFGTSLLAVDDERELRLEAHGGELQRSADSLAPF